MVVDFTLFRKYGYRTVPSNRSLHSAIFVRVRIASGLTVRGQGLESRDFGHQFSCSLIGSWLTNSGEDFVISGNYLQLLLLFCLATQTYCSNVFFKRTGTRSRPYYLALRFVWVFCPQHADVQKFYACSLDKPFLINLWELPKNVTLVSTY